MGIISASTGLNSGIDIAGTVSKLMAISAKPRDALTSQNLDLTNQQTAVTTLSALLLSVQYVTKNLGSASLFGTQTANSSNSNALSATVTGTPATGTYQYAPLQTAQSEQFLTSGFQSATSAWAAAPSAFGSAVLSIKA